MASGAHLPHQRFPWSELSGHSLPIPLHHHTELRCSLTGARRLRA
jgi:hypothetical protein